MAREKLLVISNYAPPMSTGSPLMLGRMLGGLPKGSYTLLTNRLSVFVKDQKVSDWLPCDYSFIDQPSTYSSKELSALTKDTLPIYQSRLSVIVRQMGFLADIFRIVRRATTLITNSSIERILVTSDAGTFLIGAYLAAKKTKKPLAIYLFDLYAGNAFPWPIQLVARIMEPKLFRYASTLFVTNQHTQQYLQSKYAFLTKDKFVILNHPSPDIVCTPKPKSKNRTITYVGAIYWAQLPNILDLVEASEGIPNLKVAIHGPLSSEEFQSKGLVKPHTITGLIPHLEAIQIQCHSDILFLPMAFEGPSLDILMTASPGKVAEYLKIGKPILVYAPKFSHIARYATEAGFGLVVSTKDPKKLKKAIIKLLTDSTLRKKLIANANKTQQANHVLEKVQAKFCNALIT